MPKTSCKVQKNQVVDTITNCVAPIINQIFLAKHNIANGYLLAQTIFDSETQLADSLLDYKSFEDWTDYAIRIRLRNKLANLMFYKKKVNSVALANEMLEKKTSTAIVEEYFYLQKKTMFAWVASSDDGSYQTESTIAFETEKECYEDMRDSVLQKMKWNTDFENDLEDDSTIGYEVHFGKRMIQHKSYSGLYTYKIVKV